VSTLAVLHGGASYHLNTLRDPVLRDAGARPLYLPSVAEDPSGALADCDSVVVFDRLHPGLLTRCTDALLDVAARGGTLVVLGDATAHRWLPGLATKPTETKLLVVAHRRGPRYPAAPPRARHLEVPDRRRRRLAFPWPVVPGSRLRRGDTAGDRAGGGRHRGRRDPLPAGLAGRPGGDGGGQHGSGVPSRQQLHALGDPTAARGAALDRHGALRMFNTGRTGYQRTITTAPRRGADWRRTPFMSQPHISVRPTPDVPAITCVTCGYATLQVAQIVSGEGTRICDALVCTTCQTNVTPPRPSPRENSRRRIRAGNP
jgi:hypothetical protein